MAGFVAAIQSVSEERGGEGSGTATRPSVSANEPRDCSVSGFGVKVNE